MLPEPLPGFEQTCATQEASAVSRRRPFLGVQAQSPSKPEIVTALIDPGAQVGPLPNQRLVRHLDEPGLRRPRLAAGGNQARGREGIQQRLHGLGRSQREQSVFGHAPAGVRCALAQLHQFQKHPPGERLLFRRERRIDARGVRSDRALQPSDLGVALIGERRTGIPADLGLPQQRERVLQQGQIPGLRPHIRHQGLNETRLRLDTRQGQPLLHRFTQLFRRHQQHAVRALQPWLQRRMLQTVGVKIGADTEDQMNALAVGRLEERLDVPRSHVVVGDEREQLLELIGKQERARSVGRQRGDPVPHGGPTPGNVSRHR